MDFSSKIIKNIGLDGNPSNHKIAVAMCGGVDSSVTAALLNKAGFDVIGVSCDSVKRHQKFIEKYNLPFNLISDEDKKVVNDYGVWQLKKFMGREYMGIVRTTFIIDENGKIEDVISKVNTKEHYSQIS